MSLEDVKPVSFTPIRVQQDQVAKFFKDLKSRKLVRGENLNTFEVTSKPLGTTKTIQKHTGGNLGESSGGARGRGSGRGRGQQGKGKKQEREYQKKNSGGRKRKGEIEDSLIKKARL